MPLMSNGSNQNIDFSQSQSSSHDCYLMAPANNFSYGFVGNMDPSLDNFFKQMSSTNYNDGQ